ncbi:hypothetical protein AAC387_Pa10g0869 [Persea americana]
MKEEACQNRAKIEKYDGQPFGLSNHFPGSYNADAIMHQGEFVGHYVDHYTTDLNAQDDYTQGLDLPWNEITMTQLNQEAHVQSSNDFNEITAAQQPNQANGYKASQQVDLDLLWNEATTSQLNLDTHVQSNNDFNEITAAQQPNQDNGSNASPPVDFDISEFLS